VGDAPAAGDLRTRTSLFCGALALAIAVSILLRQRPGRRHWLFAAFAADIGLWYLAQWLYHFMRADVWVRFTAVLAALLPQFALHLFDSLMPAQKQGRPKLLKIAAVLLVIMVILVLSPTHEYWWVRGTVVLYVFGLLTAGLWLLAVQGEASRSRTTKRRVRFLVALGASAAVASLADFLWFIGFNMAPIGAVLSILFLFVLSESLTRQRLVDAYDVLGQVTVSTVLAACLAAIFYVFVVLFGGFETMYLGAFLATLLILVLFEPLREKANRYIHKAFFRERVDLERAVANARADLVHVLEVDELGQVVTSALEASRRATAAALYLRDPIGSDFERLASFGPEPPHRIERASGRPLFDRLELAPSVALEQIQEDAAEARRSGNTAEAEAGDRLLAASEVLGPFRVGVCLSLHGEGQTLIGMLLIADDRVTDAFSADEVALLESLAVQIAVVVENSRQYRRMRERDRLTALGQMAAGLAHEVKNPLGAIKGAAQLLGDPEGTPLGASEREFVAIILEEVDRLDRVVGSVLDYARPSKGNPGAIDVNAIVHRTLQVMERDRGGSSFETDLDEVPLVRVDADQLRQVLMNLVRNAMQSMSGRGVVRVSTRSHAGAGQDQWVEVSVRDDGAGITPQVLKNLFVPFFTTKDRGTGLGLAISQRIVEEMGGRIDVASHPGRGSTFSVLLPAVTDPLASPRPPAAQLIAVSDAPTPAREPATPQQADGSGAVGRAGAAPRPKVEPA